MTVRELAEMVKAARDAQKAYFREPSSELLGNAKRLERELDAAVAEVLGPPNLFTPREGE